MGNNAYWKIDAPIEACPFCGSNNDKSYGIRYSVSKASEKDIFYSQCYCNKCRAYGPRIRFTPTSTSKIRNRYAAELDVTAKSLAIQAWNERD